MDKKRRCEIACATALVFTMGVYMLSDSPLGLTNWWGVVFSPLCSSAISDAAEEENGYIFRWKALEIMGKWFRFQ